MSWSHAAVLAAAISAVTLPSLASAEPPETLVVATREVPPFAYRTEDGEWHGISIDLWRAIAADLDVRYELHEASVDEMLAGVRDGRYDVAAGAVTITVERELSVDFSHPFHTAGLAIAVERSEVSGLRVAGRVLASWRFLEFVAVIAALQVLFGALIWSVERRQNAEQFPRSPLAGIFSGYWWATVTMTTVGYGDKTPRTPLGRFIGMGWMLCSVIMLSVFTASVASSLTVRELQSRIDGPDDLGRFRVGVVVHTTSEEYVRDRGLDFHRYGGLREGLRALADGELDAFVYDGPMLEDAVARAWSGEIQVLPARFQRQDYAFAVPEGSPLRDSINRLLPDLAHGGDVYVEQAR